MKLSRLYAIADVGVLRARGVGLREFAEGLRAAGVGLVQLRDKDGSPQEVLGAARVLREVMPEALLVMNDRADLAVLAGFDGVHVGQGDLSPEDAKTVLDGKNEHRGHQGSTEETQRGLVGVSTHNEEQVRAAKPTSQKRDVGHPYSGPDYIAIGPVFATGTKADAEAAVGLEGVRRARALTAKPLVAIGGITRENCRSVIEAGADSVAVISGLLVEGESIEQVAREFLERMG